MAQVTELVTKFSFKGSLSPLNQFNGGLGKAIKGLGLYTVAMKATVGVVMAFAGSILKSADAQVQLSNNTGVSIERIQELGYAASVSGSSAAALEQSISGLNSSIGKAARVGSAEFSRLGISVRDANGKIKNADQVLSEVGQRFKSLNISMSEQRTIAQSLGIDPSLVQMLNKTSGEMAEMTKKARAFGLITSEQKKHIEAFNNSITTLKFAFQSIGRQLSIALAPIMTNIVKKFTDFLQANQDLIKGGLEKLAKVLFFISEAVDRFIKLIFSVVDAIGGWKNALVLLGIIFLTTPIGQFIAMITMIILIVDDLITAFQGGDSVIRNFFLDAFGFDIVPGLKAIVAEVQWFLGKIGDILSGVKEIFIGIFTLDGDRIMSGINTVLEGIKNILIRQLSDIVGLLSSVFGFDPKPVMQNIVAGVNWLFDKIKNILGGAGEIIKGIFTLDGDMILGGVGKIVDSIRDIIIGLAASIVGLLSKAFGFDPAPVMEKITSAVTVVFDTIKQIFSGLKDVFVGIFTLDGDKVLGGVKKILTAIWDLITDMFSGLFDLWTSGWKKSVDILKNLITKVFDGLTSVLMKPVEAVKGLWNKVKGVFGGGDEPEPTPEPVKIPQSEPEDPYPSWDDKPPKWVQPTKEEDEKQDFEPRYPQKKPHETEPQQPPQKWTQVPSTEEKPEYKQPRYIYEQPEKWQETPQKPNDPEPHKTPQKWTQIPPREEKPEQKQPKYTYEQMDNQKAWQEAPRRPEEQQEDKSKEPQPERRQPDPVRADPSQGFKAGTTNIQNSRTVQQNIDMRINSTDPVVAGQVAADGINQHLDDAENMNLVRNR